MTRLRQSCFALCSLFLLGFGVSASGNLTSKTGITGSYSYSSSQPHAVVSAGGTSYSYDAAGNMTQRGNTSITYNAIGQPLTFYQATSEITRFAYDSDYNRYYQWAMLANGDTQETFYIGGNYEERITHHVGGSTSTEQYAYVNDTVLQVTTGNNTSTRYLLRNALHSVEAVLDSQGQVLERLSYDTWGKPDVTPQYTTRSYTGQEYLPRLGLFHLNGRVYDPNLGRFLSADPLVQAPDFSQSYNRYSYVWNNPVSAWDPTGYELQPIAGDDVWLGGALLPEQLFLSNLASWNGPTSWTDTGIGVGKGLGLAAQGIAELNYQFSLSGMVLGYFGIEQDWLFEYATGHDLNHYLAPNGLDEQYGAGLFSVGSVVAPVVGWVTKLSWFKRFDAVSSMGTRGYRYVSEAEVQAIKETQMLRGGRPGETFFTKDIYKSGARAQDRLSLPNIPTHRVEFRVINSPTMMRNGTKVEPVGPYTGKGAEFMTTDPVWVDVINVQVLR